MNIALTERLPKPLHDFIWSLPVLADRAPMLVIVHDGAALTGIVVVRKGKNWIAIGSGRSTAASLAAAVGDVLSQCGVPVRRAVLACSGAVTALVDLPIEADQPKPAREMLGLVRWELEPLMAEQMAAWNLGAVLQARGYIDDQGRTTLADEQVRRQGGGGGASPRFGEIAIELGLAQREQVEECLAAQAQLQSFDDHVVCAWADLGTPGEGGRSLWLTSGIGLAAQQRWVDACSRHGVRLDAILALAGAGLIAQEPARDSGVCVELTASHAAVMRLRSGRPERLAIRTVSGSDDAGTLEGMLADCLLPDDDTIWAFVPRPDAQQICDALAHVTGRRIENTASDPSKRLSSDAHPAVQAWLPFLLGMVRSQTNKEGRILPRLPAAEPLPPPFKRPQTWAFAGLLMLSLGISAYEVAAMLRQQWMQGEVSELAGIKARNERQVEKAAEDKRQADLLLKQVDQHKVEQQAAQQALDFYRNELGGRREFLSTTIAVLPEAVSSEVMLESVEETRWFELSVKAWSISQSAAYRLAKDLASSLNAWKFEVNDLQVKAQAGRSGQEGYSLQFRLVRAAPAPIAASSPHLGSQP